MSRGSEKNVDTFWARESRLHPIAIYHTRTGMEAVKSAGRFCSSAEKGLGSVLLSRLSFFNSAWPRSASDVCCCGCCFRNKTLLNKLSTGLEFAEKANVGDGRRVVHNNKATVVVACSRATSGRRSSVMVAVFWARCFEEKMRNLEFQCEGITHKEIILPLVSHTSQWRSLLLLPFHRSSSTRQQYSMPSTSSSDYSSLAADSAKHSLKRTRELFDRSATAAFVPSTGGDARLYEAAQARRIHSNYSYKQFQESKQEKNKTSDALVVSTVREDEKEEEETTTVGGALVRADEEKPKPKKQNTGGILVVRVYYSI